MVIEKDAGVKSHCFEIEPGVRLNVKILFIWYSIKCMFGLICEMFAEELKFPELPLMIKQSVSAADQPAL